MNFIKTSAVLNNDTIETFNKIPHEKFLCPHGTVFQFRNDHIVVSFLAVGLYCPDVDHGWFNNDYLAGDGKTDPKEAIRVIREGKWDAPTPMAASRGRFAPKAPKMGYTASVAKAMCVSIPISFFGRACVLEVAGDYTQVEKFISHVRAICNPETMECNSDGLFYEIVRDWTPVVTINLTGENFKDIVAEQVFSLKYLIGKDLPDGSNIHLYTGMVLGADKFKETVKNLMASSGVQQHPYAMYVSGDDYLLVVGSNSASDRDTVSEILKAYNIPRTYNDLAKLVYSKAINEKKA